jgi:L-lactate permease
MNTRHSTFHNRHSQEHFLATNYRLLREATDERYYFLRLTIYLAALAIPTVILGRWLDIELARVLGGMLSVATLVFALYYIYWTAESRRLQRDLDTPGSNARAASVRERSASVPSRPFLQNCILPFLLLAFFTACDNAKTFRAVRSRFPAAEIVALPPPADRWIIRDTNNAVWFAEVGASRGTIYTTQLLPPTR